MRKLMCSLSGGRCEVSRKSVGRKLVCVLALLVATALLAFPSVAAAERTQVGLSVPFLVGKGDMERMYAGGVRTLRVSLQWQFIELAPGQYDFRRYDQFFLDAAQVGITILPIVEGTPPFVPHTAAAYPTGAGGLARFEEVMQVLAARYGPGGRLFADNPGTPHRPVRTWQIWNEPNLGIYSPDGRPSPRSYATLLAAGNRGLRSADLGAEVVLAALAPGAAYGEREFLRRLLELRSAVSSFDSVAIHPYAPKPGDIKRQFRELASLLKKTGERDRPVWVTEFGWSTDGPKSAYQRKSRGGQAKALHQAATYFKNQNDLRLRGTLWFGWRDTAPYEASISSRIWQPYTGLFSFGGVVKPAWRVFSAAAGGRAGREPLP